MLPMKVRLFSLSALLVAGALLPFQSQGGATATLVSYRTPAGKGALTIKFDSDEQMERFLQALDPNRG